MATFNNYATLTYNGTTITSNTTTGEIVEVLAATKTAVEDSYNADGTITYAVSIINSGTAAFSGLTVSDNLGAYVLGTSTLYPLTYVDGSLKYYINGVLQSTPSTSSTTPLVITGINVPAGGNALILYTTTVNEYAPLASESVITNTATVSGTTLSSEITAQENVDVSTDPSLSITKSLCPTVVNENGQVNYTFLIQNTGNTAVTAADNLVVSDTFNPVLTGLTVTLNGTALTSDSYTYSATTGVFSTNAGVITVPAATYTQNPTTGAWSTTPGTATLQVSGTL